MISVSKLTKAGCSLFTNGDGSWDIYFDDGDSFSVREFRTILPMAIANFRDLDRNSYKWESPADFPEIIRDWFRRQR